MSVEARALFNLLHLYAVTVTCINFTLQNNLKSQICDFLKVVKSVFACGETHKKDKK